MSVADKVLELLENANHPVSGEEMAQQLGITRNSVWKAVGKLKEQGYEIEAATNRGYRLVSEKNVLTPQGVRRLLTGPARRCAIDVQDSVTSTNTLLKQIAEHGGAEGMVLIAHQQTQGKGRLGRAFFSPKGTGLYLSVLLRPRFSAEEALSITTAAAVAVAQAIDAVTGEHAQIKWVNDVYLRGRKVCGILTEAAVDFESGGLQYAVLGMGVNVREPEGGFSPQLRDIAGALYRDQVPPGARTRLAAEILNRFFTWYEAMPARPFMEEYRRRCLLTGLEVTYTQGERSGRCRVLGVDEEARLQVRLPDGRETAFSTGEVQLSKDFLDQLRQGPKEETP